MAVLAHALQLVGGWIAPLIIFLVKKDSLFVRFHALQALLLQITYFVCFFVGMAMFMVSMITTVAMHAGDKSAQPPVGMFLVFPFFWLFAMGSWVIMLVCSIVYAIKAGHGEWAEYPLLGKLARKFLKMDVPPPPVPSAP
jgi:hypothetical protein